ncbi:MAG: VacJ family lipoprotein [Pseudomonadota bacterium]
MFRTLAVCALLASLAACSVPPPGDLVYDPSEPANRKVHNFNKALDRQFLSPVAKGYGAVVPLPVDRAVSNFATNAGIPGEIINSTLQLNFEDVATNTIRFVTNTVFGVGGIFDAATWLGMTDDVDTDFGETLFVYGLPEGEYLELPIFGPSTERAAWGLVVDFFLDPFGAIAPSDVAQASGAIYVVDKVGDRNEFDSVISGILYGSEDSYVTARSLYLQNRRFKLQGGSVDVDNLEDPYAD